MTDDVRTLSIADVESRIENYVYPPTPGWPASTFSWDDLALYDTLTINDLGDVLVVHEFGGEGQGDHAEIIVKVSHSGWGRYFRKTGYYASYSGTEWDGYFSEVTPVERVVTVWELVARA